MWAVITKDGLIRLVVEKLSPFAKFGDGERIVKYEPPKVDPKLYLTLPVIPVTGDRVEFTTTQQPNYLEKIQEQRIQTIQQHLDAEAKKKGYDSILSAVTYGLDPTSVFYNEAIKFAKWRSQCWETGFSLLAQVRAGEIPVPSETELIGLLPKFEEIV